MIDLAHVEWRKSSRSGNQGACVEVAAVDGTRWRTSSRSGTQGNCVEVATNLLDAQGSVYVRDSKNRDGAILAFTPAEWTTFLASAKEHKFDVK